MNLQQQHALYKAHDEQQHAGHIYRIALTQHEPESSIQYKRWNQESTARTLTKLLDLHAYQLRGATVGDYYEPYAYAVHPDYITAFDDGLYDETTRTWSPAIDELPPRYALLHLFPQ